MGRNDDMYNRRYDKVFIMLKQELGGFSLGQQSAWGSCIMELKNKKGKLSISVQGLKKLTDGRRYEAFVIGGKGSAIRGICCGVVEIDQYGKGELKWEFDPDKIGKSCFQIEDLHTVAFIVKGGYGLTVPLVGYFNEKVAWKKSFQEEQEQKPDLRAAEAILSEIPKKKVEVVKKQNTVVEREPEQPKQPENIVKEQKIQTTAELKAEQSPFQKNFKDMLFRFREELEKLEEKGILTKQDKQSITNREIQQQETEQIELQTTEQAEQQKVEVVEQMQQIEEQTQQIVEQAQSEPVVVEQNKEIAYILQNNDDMKPFEQENWKSIALEELAVLPIHSTEVMKNLFYIFAYRKYKHFILQKIGEREYMLGVPAQYDPETRREAEHLLFETFQPCGREVMRTGCYGYWLRKIK